MNVIECIRNGLFSMECKTLQRVQTVNVLFDNNGREDETQFNISRFGTPAGEAELSNLYSTFCEENKITPDTVLGLRIVRSGKSFEELEFCEA